MWCFGSAGSCFSRESSLENSITRRDIKGCYGMYVYRYITYARSSVRIRRAYRTSSPKGLYSLITKYCWCISQVSILACRVSHPFSPTVICLQPMGWLLDGISWPDSPWSRVYIPYLKKKVRSCKLYCWMTELAHKRTIATKLWEVSFWKRGSQRYMEGRCWRRRMFFFFFVSEVCGSVLRLRCRTRRTYCGRSFVADGTSA